MEKLNSANVIHWALWDSAGLLVAVQKQTWAPRCIGSTEDTPTARQIIEKYERGEHVGIAPKSLMASYRRMVTAAKALQAGRIGGTL